MKSMNTAVGAKRHGADGHNGQSLLTLKDTMRLRTSRTSPMAATALVCTLLLSGCSLWQSITDSSASPAKPVQFAEPGACTDCLVTSKPTAPDTKTDATTSPVVVAAATQVQALESSVTQAAPAARPAAAATPVAAAIATPAAKSAELAHGYYINVGLFAVPANGARAHQKLKDAGLPVTSEVVDTQRGSMTRVRVGPYAKRSQADAVARKIRAVKLDAYVFRR